MPYGTPSLANDNGFAFELNLRRSSDGAVFMLRKERGSVETDTSPLHMLTDSEQADLFQELVDVLDSAGFEVLNSWREDRSYTSLTVTP